MDNTCVYGSLYIRCRHFSKAALKLYIVKSAIQIKGIKINKIIKFINSVLTAQAQQYAVLKLNNCINNESVI